MLRVVRGRHGLDFAGPAPHFPSSSSHSWGRRFHELHGRPKWLSRVVVATFLPFVVASALALAFAGGTAAIGAGVSRPRVAAAATSATARAADSSSSGPPSGDPLRDWLRALRVHIPNQTNIEGLGINLTNGLCTDFDVEGVDTAVLTGPRLALEVRGLDFRCRMRWSTGPARDPGLQIAGDASAQVGNHSEMGFSLSLPSDNETVSLPAALVVSSCSGNISVYNLTLSGAKHPRGIDRIIQWLLNKILQSAICALLENLATERGSMAMSLLNALLRQYNETNSTSPPPPRSLPGPPSDYIDFSTNQLVQLAHRLLKNVLGNMSSPYNLNNISTQLIDPHGELSLDKALPIDFGPISILDLAVVHVTLNGLDIGGLNNWSTLWMSADQPYQVAFGMLLQELVANASIVLTIAPSSGFGGFAGSSVLSASFVLSLAVQDLGAGAAGFLALNGTQLTQLSVDQLTCAGCLAPTVASALETRADLSFSAARPALAPSSPGQLEGDLVAAVVAAVGLVLDEFPLAMSSLGQHALNVTLRDALNGKIESWRQRNKTCMDPKPTYTNMELSRWSAIMAGILGAVACAAFLLTPCVARKRPATNESAAPAGLMPASVLDRVLPVWDSLVLHPRVPHCFRVSLPLLTVIGCMLFVASNSGPAVNIMLSVVINGQEALSLPPLFQFSLLNSIDDMWNGNAIPLAILIAVFSGIWPFLKLLLLLFCWFAPTKYLSVGRRQRLLNFLDAYGKWSFIDTCLMVLFMVAFKFQLSTKDASPQIRDIFSALGSTVDFSIHVEPNWQFYVFLIASMVSLVAGHVMCACHRYALAIGEYGLECKYTATAAEPRGRRRLCNVLRPAGYWAGLRFVYGSIVTLSVSVVLVVVGLFLHTFQFKFLGLAGYVLGSKAVRPYSVVSLAAAVSSASTSSNRFGIYFIQGTFLFMTSITVLAYQAILIVLWCAPLSNKRQRHFFVAAQVLNGWSSLDVFAVGIVAAVLEIRKFTLFIVGDKCDLINRIIKILPIAGDIHPDTCFDVVTELNVGCWLLSAAAVIAGITGHVMLHRCSTAFCTGSGDRGIAEARDVLSEPLS